MPVLSYNLFAQSNSIQELYDTWQILIYKNGTVHGVQTFEVVGRPKLFRGNPNPKDKFQYIIPTRVDFKIKDDGQNLITDMKDQPANTYKAIIKKNGSNFFIGYATVYLSAYDFTEANPLVSIRVYDGLARLQEIYNVEDITTGLISVKPIIKGYIEYPLFSN